MPSAHFWCDSISGSRFGIAGGDYERRRRKALGGGAELYHARFGLGTNDRQASALVDGAVRLTETADISEVSVADGGEFTAWTSPSSFAQYYAASTVVSANNQTGSRSFNHKSGGFSASFNFNRRNIHPAQFLFQILTYQNIPF